MIRETSFQINSPGEADWKLIQPLIGEFKLDDQDLSIDQFIVCKKGQTLMGFVRIKKYPDCDELSSLGVLSEHRKKGIGTLLILELLKRSPGDVYIVTVVPHYFAKIGFEIINPFPSSLVQKQKECKLTCGSKLPSIMIYKK